MTEQTTSSLPDDWKKQALWAKAQYDKMGEITLAFILPLSWKEGVLAELGFQNPLENEQALLWGADVFFGNVETPVAGGWPGSTGKRYGR